MIVPSSRMLYWTGGVILPLSVLVATAENLTLPLSFGAFFFLLVVALDGFFSIGNLGDLGMKSPGEIRLTLGRQGMIRIGLANNGTKRKQVKLGILFPPEIHSSEQEMNIKVPENGQTVWFNWTCLPLKGGEYFLEKIYRESGSLLGFWLIREAETFPVAIRVYPNLMSERKHFSVLFLNKGGAGIRPRRLLGEGREFEKLREYIPGDRYERIHWKATAKSGRPVSKDFQIEKTQEVYVVIDMSRMSARPLIAEKKEKPELTDKLSKFPPRVLDRFVTSALILGVAALKQGDLFGVITFNDRVRELIRAKNGKNHFNTCREALYRIEPAIVSPDYEEVSSFIGTKLRKRALLIFLTCLDNPVLAENFNKGISLLRKNHIILVHMLRPPGVHPVFADAEAESIDDLYRNLGGHIIWSHLRKLETHLRKEGVGFNLLENEYFCAEMISRYLEIKQRQLL